MKLTDGYLIGILGSLTIGVLSNIVFSFIPNVAYLPVLAFFVASIIAIGIYRFLIRDKIGKFEKLSNRPDTTRNTSFLQKAIEQLNSYSGYLAIFSFITAVPVALFFSNFSWKNESKIILSYPGHNPKITRNSEWLIFQAFDYSDLVNKIKKNYDVVSAFRISSGVYSSLVENERESTNATSHKS